MSSAASGEPATTWAARATPVPIAERARPARSMRTPAASAQGIQAAPASWFHTSAIDSTGPDATHSSPAAAAAAGASPSARPSARAPSAARRKWPTTNAM